MIGALFYLQARSVKNRLLARLKRLKQPKYLFGAVVGGLYFYFYFFRFLFLKQGGAPGRPLPAGLDVSQWATSLEWLGALILFVIIVLAWLIPKDRAALEFTEAEVAFLFPAPVSRKTLIHFKLIRSQIRILISALFFTLLSGRLAAAGGFWIHALGWWIILSTMNLHFLGCSFVQTLLLDRGIATWKRRVTGLTLLLLAGLAVFWWGRDTMRRPVMEDLEGLRAMGNYLQQQLATGPMWFILHPFRWVVRPFLATDALALVGALGPALLLLALHYWWVMRLDVSFEEASLEAAQKRATVLAAVRSGNMQALHPARKGRKPLFQLAASGPRIMALFWKNLVVANQAFHLRFWIGALIVVTAVCLVMASRGGAWLVMPSVLAAVGFGYSLLLGPQILRQDLRQDFAVADILKTFPLSGWQVVLGELLAPAVILTVIQWSMVLFALLFSTHLPPGVELSLGLRLAIAFGVALLAPALNLLWLLIPNAAVLFFPGWFRTGEVHHGMEVMGQRLIMMLGQALMLVVSLLPAAGAGALGFFLTQMLVNREAAVLVSALSGTTVLAVEAGVGIFLLGRMFEKLDVSAETA
jgi:ABC-2 type transport system permease protein